MAMEINLQLLDCYERLAGLTVSDGGNDRLRILQKTDEFFEKCREGSGDQALTIRQVINQLELGRQLHHYARFNEAIQVFSNAGTTVAALREESLEERPLGELLSRIQFHTAISLHDAGRFPESIDSHLAAMESLSEERQGRPYSLEQRRQLGIGYACLGELFADHVESDETRSHFNEAVRLLNPICEGGAGDPESAVFLSESMARIAGLDRKASRWTDGYRMSLAAIENLEATLENHPTDVDGRLALSDLRVRHTEILRYNRTAALRCLNNGLTMVTAVQDQVEADRKTIAPKLQDWRKRIATLYDQYHELCESFGESEKARMCSDRASQVRDLLVQRETGEETRESDAAVVPESPAL